MNTLSLSDLNVLSKSQLVCIACPFVRVPKSERSSKASVIQYLLDQPSVELRNAVVRAVLLKKERDKTRKLVALQTRNQKKRFEQNGRREEARRRCMDSDGHFSDHVQHYLDLPTPEETRLCYRNFYNATSSDALKMSVCAVCAHEQLEKLQDMTLFLFDEIPNSARLVPKTPHSAQRLTRGLLLELSGVKSDESGLFVQICGDCRNELLKVKNLPPRLSLANDLWIGEQPSQLKTLKIAEQLLISLVYPRVFVFKLFPKQGCSWDDESLQRGRGQVPKKFLRQTFGVRRAAVHAALVWLKMNNPKYFGDITISHENLQEVPEDDVPVEIIDTIRQCDDGSVLEKENDSYVRRDAAPTGHNEIGNDDDIAVPIADSESPDVIPFDISGAIDTDLSKLTSRDMSQWALRNLWTQGKEGPYEVRHGTKPVSDYGPQDGGNSHHANLDTEVLENYWEKTFPFLFPYGRGGFENLKPNHVSLRQHIRWALEYHDKRFQKDEKFPFVAFSILQRREALASAKVQIERQSYERNLALINSITLDKFKEAERAEANNEHCLDPGILFLKNQVRVAGGHVMGSDYSRIKLRSQIWSTTLYMGPPSVWLTVNPSDIHDPIAQIFTGVDINMDHFLSSVGPDSKQRGLNIAANPYAASMFFHFLVDCILETLIGIKVVQHRVKSDVGIFGNVSAYFGMVESQGRGTLHLHMLLWLKNTPSSDRIRDLLQTEPFREKIRCFIKANFRAYLPGLDDKESINLIPDNKDITYSRPVDPDEEDYDQKLSDFELRLAKMEQIHTCRPKSCLNMDRSGQLKCKRRAPFPCSQEDFVTDKGQWGPKRLYGYVNSWVPGILVNARCNNDGKLLTNGEETKNITFYVTSYAVKKQGRTFNMSAVMAKGYAYHAQHPMVRYSEELKDAQRLLLFRLLNAINREQELSAPMVVSYLMGWGDTKISHTYTPIYWTGFVRTLMQQFPDLSSGPTRDIVKTDMPSNENVPLGDIDSRENGDLNDVTNMHMLQMNSQGQIFCASQVLDYQSRGSELETLCVLDFFVDTYEENILRTSEDQDTIDLPDDNTNVEESVKMRRGRPRNQRSHYLDDHPRRFDKCRVRRSTGHRNLPNLVGCRFPRSDDKDSNDLYCASVLLLLKPWRRIKDLKLPDKSWTQCLQITLQESPLKARFLFVMSGLQYHHECLSAASDTPNDGDIVYDEDDMVNNQGMASGHILRETTKGLVCENVGGLTEEGLCSLLSTEVAEREQIHADHAIGCAKYANIFLDQSNTWALTDASSPASALGGDIQLLQKWKLQMEEDIIRQNGEMDMHSGTESGDTVLQQHIDPSVTPSYTVGEHRGQLCNSMSTEEAIAPIPHTLLNDDQRRAFDIIVEHLDNTLAGRDQPQLRMILYGEGGTGKSKVIQTVTQAFVDRNVKHLLVKAAYTGVAASLIDGKTTHTLASLNIRSDGTVSQGVKKKLQTMWDSKQYLILDEYSMLGKSFLTKLSKNICIGKMDSATGKADLSFGGVNVILCGDLHQFPPVAQSLRECLFKPTDLTNDNNDQKIGRSIYEEFNTVVVLKKQMRVTDPIWRDFLTRLRYGNVQDVDIEMLKGLVIGDESIQTNFTKAPWSDALLVTPRHAVRLEWNRFAVRKHCTNSGRRLFICTVEDRIGQRALTLAERYAVAQRSHRKRTERRRNRNDLPREVELAVGMKVLVTNNLETDLDITNGARGTVVDVILHPDEYQSEQESIVRLQHLPVYVLIKLERTRASKLDGLQEGVIPIEPMSATFEIKLLNEFGSVINRTVRRRQYPITAAYSFTDYRAQGQTIPVVIVDIASPPSGMLSLFNLYVALSRSTGRDTVRLLRSFHENVLLRSHDNDLLAEDDRLESLDEETKRTKRVGH